MRLKSFSYMACLTRMDYVFINWTWQSTLAPLNHRMPRAFRRLFNCSENLWVWPYDSEISITHYRNKTGLYIRGSKPPRPQTTVPLNSLEGSSQVLKQWPPVSLDSVHECQLQTGIVQMDFIKTAHPLIHNMSIMMHNNSVSISVFTNNCTAAF